MTKNLTSERISSIMLIDNKKFSNNNPTVIKYLEDNLQNGDFKLVSGYYTIATLQKLLPKFSQLNSTKLILGKLSGFPNQTNTPNHNKKSTESSNFNLQQCFEYLVGLEGILEYLESNKANIKSVDPDFCHAKCYIYTDADAKHSFAISGSSNLTPSGLGMYPSSNVELNHVFQGGIDHNYNELNNWYDSLWNSAKNNKQEVINEIKNYYKTDYTPEEVYQLILWHLFQDQIKELQATEEIVDLLEIYVDKKILANC